LLQPAARFGRRRRGDWPEVLKAIRHLVRSGCGWRMLPQDFPPWQIVYWSFGVLMCCFLLVTIHDIPLMIDR